eukprot:gnl/Hemi2/9047_TR3128_c0_g1_i1.p1 gnl/Hemi2/9047_TR3128_c0_g1~~gnl/Hemi2/9047_TR3128_c0_g1_i1.p1  ORF type:complete len:340 (-),score=69.28 gnl/Hemi2/9047_TR3128_c0_g1_i1:193-1116(-)
MAISNLGGRLKVAVLIIPPFFYALLYWRVVFSALVAFLIIKGIQEFYALLPGPTPGASRPLIVCAVWLCGCALWGCPLVLSAAFALAAMALFTRSMLLASPAAPPSMLVTYLFTDVFGLAVIIWPLAYIILIRMRFGAGLTLLLLGTSWMSDTGALVFGSLFGRHSLGLMVSPAKTWEGVFGALLWAVATSTAGFVYGGDALFPEFHWLHYSAMGLVIAVAGIFGDLCESFLKRLGQVADSGSFFAAQGGVLDRLDSFLFAGPALFFYLHFVLDCPTEAVLLAARDSGSLWALAEQAVVSARAWVDL